MEAGVTKVPRSVGGLGKFVTVPGKDVTARADGGVARRELKGVARDRMLAQQVDELQQLAGGVGGVGVVHCRARVAQRPAR